MLADLSYCGISLCCRLLAFAFGMAYKMVCEIDEMILNKSLARLLCISLFHFNEIESEICMALDFNVGVT